MLCSSPTGATPAATRLVLQLGVRGQRLPLALAGTLLGLGDGFQELLENVVGETLLGLGWVHGCRHLNHAPDRVQ